jgi:hypothetical protein
MALRLYDGKFKDFFSLMKQTVFYDGWSGRCITENTMFQRRSVYALSKNECTDEGKTGVETPPLYCCFLDFEVMSSCHGGRAHGYL